MAKTKITKMEDLPDMLSAEHISGYLGISRTTVYTLFQTPLSLGGIPNFEIGISKRADKEDFIRWIDERKADKENKFLEVSI